MKRCLLVEWKRKTECERDIRSRERETFPAKASSFLLLASNVVLPFPRLDFRSFVVRGLTKGEETRSLAWPRRGFRLSSFLRHAFAMHATRPKPSQPRRKEKEGRSASCQRTDQRNERTAAQPFAVRPLKEPPSGSRNVGKAFFFFTRSS